MGNTLEVNLSVADFNSTLNPVAEVITLGGGDKSIYRNRSRADLDSSSIASNNKKGPLFKFPGGAARNDLNLSKKMPSPQNTDHYDTQGNRTESTRDVFATKTSKNVSNPDNLAKSSRGATTKSAITNINGIRRSVSPNGGLNRKIGGNVSEKLKKGVNKVKISHVLSKGGMGEHGGGKKVADKYDYKMTLVKRLFKNFGKMDKGQIMGKYYQFMSRQKVGMSLKDKLFLAVSQNQISDFED